MRRWHHAHMLERLHAEARERRARLSTMLGRARDQQEPGLSCSRSAGFPGDDAAGERRGEAFNGSADAGTTTRSFVGQESKEDGNGCSVQ